jgi:hypothetical protein
MLFLTGVLLALAGLFPPWRDGSHGGDSIHWEDFGFVFADHASKEIDAGRLLAISLIIVGTMICFDTLMASWDQNIESQIQKRHAE